MLRHISSSLSVAPTRQKARASRGKQPLCSLTFTLFIPVSVCSCCIWGRVLLFFPLDTPHSRIAPGPLVECCIERGLWRKGIPGQRGRAQACKHTHANALTDTCKHIRMDKYSCWEPSQPFGRRPNQRPCWKTCI